MPAKPVQWAARSFPAGRRSITEWKSVNEAIPVVSEISGRGNQSGIMGEPVSTPSRVIVVEPNVHTRTHFKVILHSANDFELTGEFSNANEALKAIPRSPSDLMVLGVHRRDPIGIKCINLFKRLVAGLKIIIVLGAGDTDLLESSLRSGADNCLVKPVKAAQYLATLRFAARGQNENMAKSQEIQPAILHRNTQGKCVLLNQREEKVMSCLAEGLLYKEISDKLGISYPMVHKYQHSAFRKLHAGNRSEAIRAWLNGSNVV